MSKNTEPVDCLPNIGATVARRLHDIGVRTRGDLETIGAVEAYRRICARNPGKTMPVCYYLYSLEGALRGKHWDALGESVKRSLLERAKLDARKGRRPATAKR